MPVFDLPDVLHPTRESDKCIRVPNVTVGKVQIDKKNVAVFSAFFSHACMLDKSQWKVIQVPLEHVKIDGVQIEELSEEALAASMEELSVDEKKTLPVFVDPITLNVFEGCTWHFYSGNKEDIAFMRAYVDEHDSRTAWYDVGTRYGAAMEKLKRSVSAAAEPPTKSIKKTEISKTSEVYEKDKECRKRSKVSPLSSETEVEA